MHPLLLRALDPVFLPASLLLLYFLSVLLILWTSYVEYRNYDTPPGLAYPLRLRAFHTFMIFVALLGKILESLEVCSQVEFQRFTRERLWPKPALEDSQLDIQDLLFDGVLVRVYQPKSPFDGHRKGVLFFHGGGWMFGTIDSYDRMCRFISVESNSVVLSVGYRRSPEHRYPTQYEDCYKATVHFLRVTEFYGVDPTKVIISGDSMGGTLAAAVCQGLEKRKDLLPMPLAQVLIYPVVQMVDFNLPSYQQNRLVPLMLRERVVFYALQYLNGDMSAMDAMLEGTHVPDEKKQTFQKWLSPDNIPDQFKVRGYTPPATTTPDERACEKVKDAFEMACSPLLSEDNVFRGLPKAYILTCEYDVLRDDGLLYKKRLEDLNIPVTWYHVTDGFHGVVSFFDHPFVTFPAGKLALQDIVNFIKSA